MMIKQRFFNQSGIIRNEQLRTTRILSKDFSFSKWELNGSYAKVLKRKHFEINPEYLLFLDKDWTLFSSCGFLKSPEGNWITDSFSFPFETEFKSYFNQQIPAKRSVHLSGIYFVFTNVGFSNYYHVLTELLPRLEFYMPFIGKVKLLVSENIPSFLAEAFDLLGITNNDIQLVRDGIEYTADTLMTIPWGLNFIPERFEFIKNNFLKRTVDYNADKPKSKRIYVSRKSESNRSIVNEEDIIPILDSFGFECVESQKMSLSEQITLFSTAAVICGPHGAGLSNLLWMSSPKVIEIRPENFANDCFLHAALIKNASNYAVFETNTHGDEKTMTVNPILFDFFLSQFFSPA